MTATITHPATPATSPARLRLRVTADARLAGPFTAASGVLRALVPLALVRDPGLVRRHDIEIRAVAPALRRLVPGTRETLTSSASPQGRTRFYPRARVTRLAHGVTEFVLACVAAGDLAELVVTGADRADATDAEWLAILRRRAAGTGLVLTIEDTEDTGAGEDAEGAAERSDLDESRDPAWHDAQAYALIRRAEAGDDGLRLGAIPHHLDLPAEDVLTTVRTLQAIDTALSDPARS